MRRWGLALLLCVNAEFAPYPERASKVCVTAIGEDCNASLNELSGSLMRVSDRFAKVGRKGVPYVQASELAFLS
jgi:hypothetical protein